MAMQRLFREIGDVELGLILIEAAREPVHAAPSALDLAKVVVRQYRAHGAREHVERLLPARFRRLRRTGGARRAQRIANQRLNDLLGLSIGLLRGTSPEQSFQ